MAKIEDVAAYILARCGPMTAMKLQKLCYYAQAWHLVWEERPLFDSRIEAWANGPIVVDLYRMHRGRFNLAVGELAGDPEALDKSESGSVDAVLNTYAPMTAHQLSELTHTEPPWLDARQVAGLAPMDRGNAEITHESMAWYYDALTEESSSNETWH